MALLAGVTLAGCAGAESEAGDEAFPTKPVEIIVPFAAGGATDSSARALVPQLEKSLGQSVVVVNKPSAGGVVGISEATTSTPDGYTLLYAPTGALTQAATTPESTFKWDQLEPIHSTAQISAVLVTSPDSGLKTLDDIKDVDGLKYATNGVGTFDHIDALSVIRALGTSGTAVPFNGGTAALQAVLSNKVSFYVTSNPATTVAQAKAGKLLPLGVVTLDGSRLGGPLSDVPSLQEGVGLSDDEVFAAVQGLMAPKGLDPAKRDILAKAMGDAVKGSEFTTYLEQNYYSLDGTNTWYDDAAGNAGEIADLIPDDASS